MALLLSLIHISQGIEDFYNIDVPNNGTIERLLELSDKAGVNKVVIHSPATTPHQVQSVNNFIYDCTDVYKRQVFVWDENLNPYCSVFNLTAE